MDFRVCACRIRHGSHHGGACPRLARLRFRQALRARDTPAHRGMRRQRGEFRRQGRHRVQLSGSRMRHSRRFLAQRTDRQGGDSQDKGVCHLTPSGTCEGELPPARRHLLAPALLGRAVPGILQGRHALHDSGRLPAAAAAGGGPVQTHRKRRAAARTRPYVGMGHRRQLRDRQEQD